MPDWREAMSNIPDSIREQAERADQIMEELQKSKAVTQEQGPDVDPEIEHGVESDAAPEQGPEQLERDAPHDVGFGESVSPKDKERTDYKALYHTLKGKYDAEVPRLHSTTNALQKRLVELENMLATRAAPTKQPEPQEDYRITDEEREAFGDDLLSVVQKQAMQLLLERENAYKQQLDELRQQLEQVGSTTLDIEQKTRASEQSAFFSAVRAEVPEFESINHSPKFLAWLEEPDVYTGVRKLDLLRQAGAAMDVNRAAAFFRAYMTEEGISPSSPSAKKNNLGSHIAPSKGTSGVPYAGNQKSTRVFTRDDITAFYRDVVEGKYKGREADKQQLEREIISAGAEGRIK